MISFIKKYKAIFSETVWYTIANFYVQITSLLRVIFVSRYLGPTNIGIYSFVQNYIAVFVTVITAIDIYINWEIVSKENKKQELIRFTKIKAYITAPLLFFLIIFANIFLPKDVFLLTLILCLPLCTSVFSGFVFLAQYNKLAKLYSIGLILSSSILLLFKVLAITNNADLRMFIFINSLDGLLLATLCTVYLLSGYYKNSKENLNNSKITFKDIFETLKSSRWTFSYIVLWFFVLKADQFFVPVYFNAESLGLYASSVKVVEMANILIVIMQAVLIPRIAKISNVENIASRKILHKVMWVYLSIGLISALFVSFFSDLIIYFLFGTSFSGTAEILRVYAWSIPPLFVSYLFSIIFMHRKNFKLLAAQAFFVCFLNVTLLYAISSYRNIYYLAYVSVFVYSISAFVYYLLWRKNV